MKTCWSSRSLTGAVLIVAMCLAACVTMHPVAIVNENNLALTNSCVVWWQKGYPFNAGSMYIWQSDSNGIVHLPDYVNVFDVGCKGYYPTVVFTRSTGQKVFPEKVVLSASDTGEYHQCCFDQYEILRTGKTRRHFEKSHLWKEWGDYLIELEGKGYYTNRTIVSTNRYVF